MAQKLLCTVFCLLLLSCTPQTQKPIQTSLYIYRFNPPAFVEFSSDFQPVKEIPFSVPRDCSLVDVFSAPVGKFLLIELGCPNGQTVLFLDSETGSVTQPVTESDSHFLAWARDGKSAYLKIDSLGDARLVRAGTNGRYENMEINNRTYDLSTHPNFEDIVFTFSHGLGYGSEMTLSRENGRELQQLIVDRFNYLSLARFSPGGKEIAFIKIPDSQTPFTVGELWVMSVDGSNPRKLTEVDAGHGYAANWSPDGKWIAFVKRENEQDQGADQAPESLISNIYLVNLQGGELRQFTSFANGRAETPYWSPDGNTLVFSTVLDGRMEVQMADIASGEIRPLTLEPACCPAWMRK